MRQLSLAEAISEAIALKMRKDPLFCAGEDIGIVPFGSTKGLLKEFGPERVKDTSISETAIVGLGVGAGLFCS